MKEEEEEEEEEGEPDPNDMSIPVGTKKLMRRCFNPVTGHTMPPSFLYYRPVARSCIFAPV
jgi:hypothetical protein